MAWAIRGAPRPPCLDAERTRVQLGQGSSAPKVFINSLCFGAYWAPAPLDRQ
ncbi:hypothetical protein C2845_PM11G23680 [Panicum miliaceum]|uniref:Uncharacterized protein n=1 Tax=Panicum miliaceum TaxID=4540 RepID=A0A3L6RX42_PANMI|nr:hypothetical protein C2845_PM11G23680 [Panicum miliaceum]